MQCLQPVRLSLKRSLDFELIDPEQYAFTTKRCQLEPTRSLLPTPFLSHRNSSSNHPSQIERQQPHERKGAFGDEDTSWTCKISTSALEISAANIQRPASAASTSNTKATVSDPLYREVIYRAGIIADLTGIETEEEEVIRNLLDTHILKERTASPRLSDKESKEVLRTAADLMDLTGGVVASDSTNTTAFPLKRCGTAEGRNVQWSSDPLPINFTYPHQVLPPESDHHYGYSPSRKFEWTDLEMAVFHHPKALPYVQTTRDNTCPFLALEFKTEATGGVLYVAENQRAGSGVHIVASQRWLQHQAFPNRPFAATDAVSFIGAVSPRTCVFDMVWWSDKKGNIMSKIRIISFIEGPDIQ